MPERDLFCHYCGNVDSDSGGEHSPLPMCSAECRPNQRMHMQSAGVRRLVAVAQRLRERLRGICHDAARIEVVCEVLPCDGEVVTTCEACEKALCHEHAAAAGEDADLCAQCYAEAVAAAEAAKGARNG